MKPTSIREILLLIAFMMWLTPVASATNRYFEPLDGIGNWDYGPHWNPSGVPLAGDDARIEAGGDGWILSCNYTNSTSPLLNRVYIGNYNDIGTAQAHLIQNQDDLHADYEYVGYYGAGHHYQSGGSVTLDSWLALGYESGSYGYYELNDGTLEHGRGGVGFAGDGDFVQTGGTHTCQNDLSIGNSAMPPCGQGTYSMQAGHGAAPFRAHGPLQGSGGWPRGADASVLTQRHVGNGKARELPTITI